MGQTFTSLIPTATSMRLLLCLFSLLPLAASATVGVNISKTDVTCFGANNGTATAVGTGGWAPYTYVWSTGATTSTITNLAPGVYSVTVTDIDLGTASGSVTITQPNQLGVTTYVSSQICGVVPDGTATAVPYGGTPPYFYTWSNGGTTAQIQNLAAGTYTVTVRDANNCTTVGTATVGWFGNEGIWITEMIVNVTCFGANNGMATAMAMSGTPPYTYLWSTGATTMKVTGLSPGNYTVTVTDANGCFGSHLFNITQPTQLVATVGTTPAACTNNGTATVTPSGGTPPYSVIWNNGQTNLTITSLAPATYTVTVTDANLCSTVKQITVTGSNTSITVNGTVQAPAGCALGGTATVSISNGSGNFTYLWDNGQTTAVATNLSVGNHTVTVIDVATGCQGIGLINIPQATPIITTIVVTTNATCSTGGTATVSASGGVAPYTYLWDNGQTTATATNLSAGLHTVTVKDATNCIVTTQATINQSQGPTVTAQPNSQATCTSGGSATATATGGQAPYAYLWDNGQTTATATNLSAGNHKVTVTDANGCAATAMVTIAQSGTPSVSITINSAATCLAGGKASALGSGGTAPYTYQWSTGATTSMVTNLAPGTYTVTVKDANNCTATATTTIVPPSTPTVVISASTSANCSQPGSATAMAAGGSSPYTYKWSNNETTSVAVNLPAGTYTVTVTDANGCTSTASVTIGQTNNGISIGDYVWYDVSQDGFQDPGETNGVSGVTVKLIRAGNDGLFGTADDVVVTTTTTNATGYYLISCVTPGTYILEFSGIPTGYEFTSKDNVNNDCKDSDAKQNGRTDPFTIVSGQGNNLCFDAGIHTVCINFTYAGQICCDQVICEGETPALLYESVAPIGGSGGIEYLWMELIQVGPAPATWMGIPGATSSSYQPGPLTKTSFFMRCIRRAGCTSFLESNIVTITVKPAGSPGCEGFTGSLSLRQAGPTSVGITWITNPEVEQYMYTVEHSINTTDWNEVTTIMGHHNASAPNTYDVIDQTPVAGTNFYRLKRTTTDGVSTFSDMANIEMNGSIAIYPNPVQKSLTIKNITKYDADVTVTITTTKGEQLQSVVIPQGSYQVFDIAMDNYPAGMYFARIRFANGDVKTIKISKF